MSSSEICEIGRMLWDVDRHLQKCASEFSEYSLESKVSIFSSLCDMVNIANEALLLLEVTDKNLTRYYKAFYQDNLALDGCYQPLLENVFEENFSRLIDDEALSETEWDLLNNAEEDYENTELVLFMHDSICDQLIVDEAIAI